MNKIKLTIILTLFATLCTAAYGQVTVGSGIDPNKGALLDIKEKDEATGGVTATKGLLMPRVNLSKKDQLYPMFESTTTPGTDNDDYNDGAKKSDQNKKHTGLVVYNLAAVDGMEIGVNSWDGTKWVAVKSGSGPVGTYKFIDPIEYDTSTGEVKLTDGTADGQALMWNGTKWVPTTLGAVNGLTLDNTNHNVELGGILTKTTTITSSSTNKLILDGTGTGATTISSPLTITSGSPENGKVLTSDDTGNASWIYPPGDFNSWINASNLNSIPSVTVPWVNPKFPTGWTGWQVDGLSTGYWRIRMAYFATPRPGGLGGDASLSVRFTLKATSGSMEFIHGAYVSVSINSTQAYVYPMGEWTIRITTPNTNVVVTEAWSEVYGTASGSGVLFVFTDGQEKIFYAEKIGEL